MNLDLKSKIKARLYDYKGSLIIYQVIENKVSSQIKLNDISEVLYFLTPKDAQENYVESKKISMRR